MSTSTRPVSMAEHQMRRRHFHARFGDRPDPAAIRAERGLLASLAASKRALSEALAVPCEQHRARPGEPCWEIPRGVCGARVDLAHTVRERY